jgi:transglutaminase-like putative cysteine protease
MKYQVTHSTKYVYQDIVSLSHNILRLTPRNLPSQSCSEHFLEVTPVPLSINNHTDYFGNPYKAFSLEEPHQELTVSASSIVTVEPTDIETGSIDSTVDELRHDLLSGNLPINPTVQQFLFDSPIVRTCSDFGTYAQDLFPSNVSVFKGAQKLMERIHRDFIFDPSVTSVHTTVEEVFKLKRGVCQDLAHFQIACLRSIGIPAKYVSGYLRTFPPPGQERLVGADVSHAWVSVYCGELGWIDMDPTNNVLVKEDHVILGWGRDYSDICPIQGRFLGGGQHSMQVSVDVVPA